MATNEIKMRPVNKYPMPSEIDDEFCAEVMEQWRKNAQAAGMQTQYYDLVKLAYKFGYNRCANLHFV